MNRIWVLAEMGGWDPGDVSSFAIAEDGEVLAGHMSSGLSWAERDMIGSGWKDGKYQAKYPGGYLLIWVGLAKREQFPGLPEALEACRRESLRLRGVTA